MSPFDIVFARMEVRALTPEEKADAKRLERKLRQAEVSAKAAGVPRVRGKRGANPQFASKKDVVSPVGEMATPRVRDWRVGEYKPDTRMREALDKARAEQPGLMSLTSKEKS